jgi:hypothetical protein
MTPAGSRWITCSDFNPLSSAFIKNMWRGSHAADLPCGIAAKRKPKLIFQLRRATEIRQECGRENHDIVMTRKCAFRFPRTVFDTTAVHMRVFMAQFMPFTVEEHVHGETVWVALRSRGADWSWLTPEEAVELGRAWIARYSQIPQAAE